MGVTALSEIITISEFIFTSILSYTIYNMGYKWKLTLTFMLIFIKQIKETCSTSITLTDADLDFRHQSRLPYCPTLQHHFATFRGCSLRLIPCCSPLRPNRSRVPTSGTICRLATVSRSSWWVYFEMFFTGL